MQAKPRLQRERREITASIAAALAEGGGTYREHRAAIIHLIKEEQQVQEWSEMSLSKSDNAQYKANMAKASENSLEAEKLLREALRSLKSAKPASAVKALKQVVSTGSKAPGANKSATSLTKLYLEYVAANDTGFQAWLLENNYLSLVAGTVDKATPSPRKRTPRFEDLGSSNRPEDY